MLSLEKNHSNKQITVKIRKKKSFFTPLLIQSFCVALGIHLLGFFIFSIHIFKLNSTFLFSPIQVKAEENLLSTPLSLLEETLSNLPDPFAPPLLAFLENFSYALPSQSIDIESPSFTPLEDHFSYPIKSKPVKINPIKILISGELAKRQLLKYDDLLDQKPTKTGPFNEPTYLSVKVQIDGVSGRVFYQKPIETSENLKINLLVQKLIEGLEFEKGEPFWQDSGTIHFVIDEDTFFDTSDPA